MTVKDASEKFHLDQKEIRKRKNDGMIVGVSKIGNRIFIPDDTAIIPAKKEIQSFLLQILKYKNNPSIVISRKFCPTFEQLLAVLDYLYKQGYIGEYTNSAVDKEVINSVQISDSGFSFIFNSGKSKALLEDNLSPVSINPTMNFNISLIHVG